jgi:hypothetical protein
MIGDSYDIRIAIGVPQSQAPALNFRTSDAQAHLGAPDGH